jgi:hypothetical protein
MVNVNARLPFNLHNKNLSTTIDASSSGSRSPSSSTNRPSLNFSPLSLPTAQSHEQMQGYVGAPLTPVTHPATSRDSSMVSREASTHESENSSTRAPILSVCLVKNIPSGAVTIAARRGRARRKGGESNGSGLGIQQEPVTTDSGLPSSDGTVADNTPRMEDFSLRTVDIVEQKLTLSISPASTVDFVLQDTGPLTVSWGD